jgi:nitrogen fixation NifU-like protein
MADLRELYQEVILEHSKAPRNYRPPADVNHSAEGYNPLCGDHFTVFLNIVDDRIRDIGFQGTGCAISKASASMMTQCIKGKTRAEALQIFKQFHHLVTGQQESDGRHPEMGKLAAFSGVCEFPARVKCATLAWHALENALGDKQEASSSK